MTSSLVGSEMCIRDRAFGVGTNDVPEVPSFTELGGGNPYTEPSFDHAYFCLLYTSDAADDM
eukprot:745453-Prorocentrum_lima.AAC.1